MVPRPSFEIHSIIAELTKLYLIEINYCAPNPCKNGATCTEKNGKYECTCLIGYKGVTCEGIVLHFDSYLLFALYIVQTYLNKLVINLPDPMFSQNLMMVNMKIWWLKLFLVSQGTRKDICWCTCCKCRFLASMEPGQSCCLSVYLLLSPQSP